MNMSRNTIYRAAIKEYGESAQLDMIIEECSELIKAVCKLKRIAYTTEDNFKKEYTKCITEIEDEAADVSIMLEQLPLIFHCIEIESRKDRKIARLAARLGLEGANG